MDIQLAACFIAVDDHERALGFYRDTLGFEVQQDVSYEGMRWVTIGSSAQPGVTIVLEPPVADPAASDEDRDAAARLLAKGLLRAVNLTSQDLDADFERIRASGADVLQEPMDQGWGQRDCAFRDPAGNMVRIAQR